MLPFSPRRDLNGRFSILFIAHTRPGGHSFFSLCTSLSSKKMALPSASFLTLLIAAFVTVSLFDAAVAATAQGTLFIPDFKTNNHPGCRSALVPALPTAAPGASAAAVDESASIIATLSAPATPTAARPTGSVSIARWANGMNVTCRWNLQCPSGMFVAAGVSAFWSSTSKRGGHRLNIFASADDMTSASPKPLRQIAAQDTYRSIMPSNSLFIDFASADMAYVNAAIQWTCVKQPRCSSTKVASLTAADDGVVPTTPLTGTDAATAVLFTDVDGDGYTSNAYFPGEVCDWTITCPTGTYVAPVVSFALGSDSDDYLELKTASGESLVRFTGQGSRAPLWATGQNVLQVAFRSGVKSMTKDRGASLTWKCLSVPQCSGRASGTTLKEASGVILSDVDGAAYTNEPYRNNENCAWTIQCPKNLYVAPTLSTALAPSDYVELSDTESGNSILKVTGQSNKRPMWKGGFNSIKVVFVTSVTGQRDRGFSLSYVCLKTPQCSFNGTAEQRQVKSYQGFIYSDVDGEAYTNEGYRENEDCDYSVSCPSSTLYIAPVIRTALATGDNLTVTDADGKVLGVYQGQSDSRPLFGLSKFFVRFTSPGGHYVDRGWSIRWQCVSSPTCSANVSLGDLVGYSGRFTTDYDGSAYTDAGYYDRERCDWSVRCPNANHFVLPEIYGALVPGDKFEVFATPAMPVPKEGEAVVQVMPEPVLVGNYNMSNFATMPFYAPGYNKLQFRFTSDNANINRGVSVGWTCVNSAQCSFNGTSRLFTALTGTIMSDADGAAYTSVPYADNENCVYEIRCPLSEKGDVLTVYPTVTTALEADGDSLSLLDENMKTIKTFTGSQVQAMTFSDIYAKIFLLFRTNANGRNRGFTVNYRCGIPSRCSNIGPFTLSQATSGVIMSDVDGAAFSGNYYRDDESCEWVASCPSKQQSIAVSLTYRTSDADDVVVLIDDVTNQPLGRFSGQGTRNLMFNPPVNRLRVNFTTGSRGTGYGFTLQYRCVNNAMCSSSTPAEQTLTAPTISGSKSTVPAVVIVTDMDGAAQSDKYYYDGERCSWIANCPTGYFAAPDIVTRLTKGDVLRLSNAESSETAAVEISNHTLSTNVAPIVGVRQLMVNFSSNDKGITNLGASVRVTCLPSATCSSLVTRDQTTFIDVQGTIQSDLDGSAYSSNYYRDGENCAWSIRCPSPLYVAAEIRTRLADRNDVLEITEHVAETPAVAASPGSASSPASKPSTAAPPVVLGSYTLNDDVAPAWLSSSGSTTPSTGVRHVDVNFRSNGDRRGYGFDLQYKCVSQPRCSAANAAWVSLPVGSYMTAVKGTIMSDRDGAAYSTNYYRDDEDCEWKIRCPDTTATDGKTSAPLTMQLAIDLRTAGTGDNVTLHDEAGLALRTYSGTRTVAYSFDVPRNALIVRFQSDRRVRGYGFTLSWTCVAFSPPTTIPPKPTEAPPGVKPPVAAGCNEEFPYRCEGSYVCAKRLTDCNVRCVAGSAAPFLCWNSKCAANFTSCDCPPSAPQRCANGRCAATTEDCGRVCDAVTCWNSACATSVSACDCPPPVTYRCTAAAIGQSMSVSSTLWANVPSNTTAVGATSAVSGWACVQAGSCVADLRHCAMDCPHPKVICWDNQCASAISQCRCRPETPYRCWNNTCVARSKDCGCPPGQQVCDDGECRCTCATDPPNGCPRAKPFKCWDGSCVAISTACPCQARNVTSPTVDIAPSAVCVDADQAIQLSASGSWKPCGVDNSCYLKYCWTITHQRTGAVLGTCCAANGNGWLTLPGSLGGASDGTPTTETPTTTTTAAPSGGSSGEGVKAFAARRLLDNEDENDEHDDDDDKKPSPPSTGDCDCAPYCSGQCCLVTGECKSSSCKSLHGSDKEDDDDDNHGEGNNDNKNAAAGASPYTCTKIVSECQPKQKCLGRVTCTTPDCGGYSVGDACIYDGSSDNFKVCKDAGVCPYGTYEVPRGTPITPAAAPAAAAPTGNAKCFVETTKTITRCPFASTLDLSSGLRSNSVGTDPKVIATKNVDACMSQAKLLASVNAFAFDTEDKSCLLYENAKVADCGLKKSDVGRWVSYWNAPEACTEEEDKDHNKKEANDEKKKEDDDDSKPAPPPTVSALTCVPWTPCTSKEYELTPPSRTADRRCAPLTECGMDEYVAVNRTNVTDRVCRKITPCQPGTYRAVPATQYADNVCKACRTCGDGEYEARECNATSDRLCLPVTEPPTPPPTPPPPPTPAPTFPPPTLPPQPPKPIHCCGRSLTIPALTLPPGETYVISVTATAPNNLTATDSVTMCVKSPPITVEVQFGDKTLPNTVDQLRLYAKIRDAPYQPNQVRWTCCEGVTSSNGECNECPAPFADLRSFTERDLVIKRTATELFPLGTFVFRASYRGVSDTAFLKFRQGAVPVVSIRPVGCQFVDRPLTLYGAVQGVEAGTTYTLQWFKFNADGIAEAIVGATGLSLFIPANSLTAGQQVTYKLICTVTPTLQGDATIKFTPKAPITSTCVVKGMTEGHLISRQSKFTISTEKWTDDEALAANLRFMYGWYVNPSNILASRTMTWSPFYQTTRSTTVEVPLLENNPGSIKAVFWVAARLPDFSETTDVARITCEATVYANTMSSDLMMATEKEFMTAAVTNLDVTTVTTSASSLIIAARGANNESLLMEARNNVVEALHATITPTGVSTELSSSARANTVALLAGIPMKPTSTTASSTCDSGCNDRVEGQVLSLMSTILKPSTNKDEQLDTKEHGDAALGILGELPASAGRANALESLSKCVAAQTDPGTSVVLRAGANIVAASSYGADNLKDGLPVSVGTGDAQMTLPLDIKFDTSITEKSVVSLGVAQQTGNPYGNAGLSTKDTVSSTMVEFNVAVDGQQIVIKNLPIPINISLPVPPPPQGQKLRCVYWENRTQSWSSTGVKTVMYDTVTKTVSCETSHLSLFSTAFVDESAPEPLPEATTTTSAPDSDDGWETVMALPPLTTSTTTTKAEVVDMITTTTSVVTKVAGVDPSAATTTTVGNAATTTQATVAGQSTVAQLQSSTTASSGVSTMTVASGGTTSTGLAVASTTNAATSAGATTTSSPASHDGAAAPTSSPLSMTVIVMIVAGVVGVLAAVVAGFLVVTKKVRPPSAMLAQLRAPVAVAPAYSTPVVPLSQPLLTVANRAEPEPLGIIYSPTHNPLNRAAAAPSSPTLI